MELDNLSKRKKIFMGISFCIGKNTQQDIALNIVSKKGWHKKYSMHFFQFSAYIGWGLLLSLQPPFYPLEAEKKGATPSQYGFVFGIANLAAFIFAPIFGKFGAQIGPKLLYNVGAFTQGFVGVSFGFLKYVQDAAPFLGLSYFLR